MLAAYVISLDPGRPIWHPVKSYISNGVCQTVYLRLSSLIQGEGLRHLPLAFGGLSDTGRDGCREGGGQGGRWQKRGNEGGRLQMKQERWRLGHLYRPYGSMCCMTPESEVRRDATREGGRKRMMRREGGRWRGGDEVVRNGVVSRQVKRECWSKEERWKNMNLGWMGESEQDFGRKYCFRRFKKWLHSSQSVLNWNEWQKTQ